MRLSSGASHDAMTWRACADRMISCHANGTRHNEAETHAGDLAAGARVLTAALIELATAESPDIKTNEAS